MYYCIVMSLCRIANILSTSHSLSDHISQMVTYLFVIGVLESWKVQKCKV